LYSSESVQGRKQVFSLIKQRGITSLVEDKSDKLYKHPIYNFIFEPKMVENKHSKTINLLIYFIEYFLRSLNRHSNIDSTERFYIFNKRKTNFFFNIMKHTHTFFKEIFDIKENSDAGLLHFTRNHIENLQKYDTDGKYDSLIQKTSYLFQRFLDVYIQKREISSTKRDQTSEVDLLLEETKEQIRKLAASIRAYHCKDSEIYRCFFPKGLSEYSRTTKSNITHLMSIIYFAVEKYQNKIDPVIIDNVFKTEQLYQSSRKEQIKRKKAFESNIENKRELRKQLAIQLQINLFELAKEYIGFPHKESSFFNYKLLKLKTFNHQNHLLLKNAKELVN
jgi:hypothetical protein